MKKKNTTTAQKIDSPANKHNRASQLNMAKQSQMSTESDNITQ